jgi:ABC-type transport system involved in multi-copper enzyme maturation permease subunit
MSIMQQRWHNIGPHGFYDLVRLARRGRSMMVRVLYVLALFGALAATYFSTIEEPPGRVLVRRGVAVPDRQALINQNARIAERFSITVLVAQNIAVLVLMPIYIAAGMQEERNRRTLPLLFTTHLTAWEIVVGKLLSRVGMVGSVLLSGLPVLAFAQLWGGIDMEMIAANFWNTLLLLFSVGAFSMLMAIQSRSLIMALMKSYFPLAGILMCGCWPMEGIYGSSPFLLRPSSGGMDNYLIMWGVAGVLTLVQGIVAYGLVRLSARWLNRQRGEDRFAETAEVRADSSPNRHLQLPPIGENAVAWKECYIDASPDVLVPVLFMALLPCLYVVHLLVWGNALQTGNRTQLDGMLELFAWIMIAILGLYIILVTVRLTGCIVREKERQSLDSLLLLPLTTTEFLRAKMVGNLRRYWPALLPFASTWLVVLFFGDLAPWAGFLLLIAVAVHLCFFAMLALFLSVVCETSVSAYVTLALVLLTLLIGTVACPILVPGLADWCYALNPVGCWITIMRDWWRKDQYSSFVEIAGCLVFYLAAAMALAVAARRRFHRD